MADLAELLDSFDRLVAAAAEVDPERAATAGEVGRRERRRRGYLGETVVVALAGGTGSGKSSLVNAMAGEEVAVTGPQRPTTSTPLAWIPSNPEPGLVRLLDDMGVQERIGQERVPWLAVIDLPDTDSVAEEHRRLVERMLPEVDAVVWVMDPEKYQDRALHEDYLAPLAAHGSRFRFVLNQIDRVREADRTILLDDLAASLRSDGIDSPVVLATAADPSAGDPWGVEELIDALRSLGEAKEVVHRRIFTDVCEAAEQLAESIGVETGGGTGFGSGWDRIRSSAAASIASDLAGTRGRAEVERAGRSAGRGAVRLVRPSQPPPSIPVAVPSESGPGRRVAVSQLDAMLASLGSSVAGNVRDQVRRVRGEIDHAVEDAALAVAVSGSVVPGDPPRWWDAARRIRWAGAATLAVGLLLLVDAVRADGPITMAGLLVAAGLAALVVPHAIAARSGGRWAGLGFDGLAGEVTGRVERELDRRIGRPLRDALRTRAGAATAYTEFRLLADAHLGSGA
jgi:GTP-binding protein EngB required for normal cell division